MTNKESADGMLSEMVVRHLSEVWMLSQSVHPEWDGLSIQLLKQDDSAQAKIVIDYMTRKDKNEPSR